MPVQLQNTILYQVQFACRMLSLAPPIGVFDSADENAILMGTTATLAGIMVNDARDWQGQRVEVTFTGDGTTIAHTLPTDFARFVDGTGWNITNQMPVIPLNPQQWK